MNDELRVDHHPKSLDSILNLLLTSAIWIGEYVTNLSKYFAKVLPLLFIAVNLDEWLFDLVQEGLGLEHLLDFVQVFVMALLRILNFIIWFLPKQDTQIVPVCIWVLHGQSVYFGHCRAPRAHIWFLYLIIWRGTIYFRNRLVSLFIEIKSRSGASSLSHAVLALRDHSERLITVIDSPETSWIVVDGVNSPDSCSSLVDTRLSLLVSIFTLHNVLVFWDHSLFLWLVVKLGRVRIVFGYW